MQAPQISSIQLPIAAATAAPVSVTVNPYPTPPANGTYGSFSPSNSFESRLCGVVTGLNVAYMSGAILAFAYGKTAWYEGYFWTHQEAIVND